MRSNHVRRIVDSSEFSHGLVDRSLDLIFLSYIGTDGDTLYCLSAQFLKKARAQRLLILWFQTSQH